MTLHTRTSILARAVAQGAQRSDLLPQLHRELLATTCGSGSVILQQTGHSGEYSATSSLGFAEPGGTWLEAEEAAALATAVGEMPRVCRGAELGALHRRLEADEALIVPLTGPESGTFLVVAAPRVPPGEALEIAGIARVELALALELVRLGRDAALHRHVQELLLGFATGISATLSVAGALASLSSNANALFGTRRTSVWLHDRRARELVLAASSDPEYAAAATRVATTSDAIAARGLRLDRPQTAADGDDRVLIAPMRGWRRALGTLVIEGTPVDVDDRQFVDAAYELGRQLSVALENVQLLEEVLQQRRLLEDTFNSLIDLVVVADTRMRVVQVNHAFAARVGRTRRDVFEKPLADFIGAEMAWWTVSPDPAPRTADPAISGARTKQFTDECLGGIFAATVTPLINQDGVPVGRVLVARDITAQTQLETEREALRGRLAQSERLASLGQFVAGIAHEMNNPLQGVLGHLELLIESSEAARPLRATLRRIYQDGDRAAKIVRNLLVFTGSRRMTRARLRVDRVLARALASRAAALKRCRIEVTRQQADNVPAVAGDALLLQQALLNILINAEHAVTSRPGPGRIDTSISTSTDRRTVLLSVGDTGPGIPPNVLPHIFDPFFTTKEVGQGTGLGLAITYGIIQEHGGTIHASNRPEGGAQLTIELPAVHTSPDGTDVSSAEVKTPKRKAAARRASAKTSSRS